MEPVTLEDLVEDKLPTQTPPRCRQWYLHLLADVAAAAVLLCTFALFHHVLPQSATPSVTPPTVTDDDELDSPFSEMEKTFTEHFQFAPIADEDSYISQNMMIETSTHTMEKNGEQITYYLADVYVRTMDCFRTALANDTFGATAEFLDISKANEAIMAVSGDYYTWNRGGPVIRNGVLYRNKQGTADVCVLYKDGSMKTVNGRLFNAEEAIAEGAWQAWAFGPSLLTADGKAATTFNSTLTDKHPRCAIGYYQPGHYVFVLVDGRQDHSVGMTLSELAELFESLGCTVAYNLDGGRSAQMAFNNSLLNQPYRDGRVVSDIVYLREVE